MIPSSRHLITVWTKNLDQGDKLLGLNPETGTRSQLSGSASMLPVIGTTLAYMKQSGSYWLLMEPTLHRAPKCACCVKPKIFTGPVVLCAHQIGCKSSGQITRLGIGRSIQTPHMLADQIEKTIPYIGGRHTNCESPGTRSQVPGPILTGVRTV